MNQLVPVRRGQNRDKAVVTSLQDPRASANLQEKLPRHFQYEFAVQSQTHNRAGFYCGIIPVVPAIAI